MDDDPSFRGREMGNEGVRDKTRIFNRRGGGVVRTATERVEDDRSGGFTHCSLNLSRRAEGDDPCT